MSPLIKAGIFLIEALFDLYIFALILRFLFQMVRADFFNPVSQAIVKVTNPPLIPLRRFIPGFRGLDMACLLVIAMVCWAKLMITYGIIFKSLPFVPGLFVWSVGDITQSVINLFFFAIIAQAILSWVNPYGNHPIASILYKITNPIMKPFRRFIPPIGGFDITPIFAILLLQVLGMLNREYIIQMGQILATR